MGPYLVICVIAGLVVFIPTDGFAYYYSSETKWDISGLEEIPVVIMTSSDISSKTISHVKEVVLSEQSYNIEGSVSFFGWNGIIENMNHWGNGFLFPKLKISETGERKNAIVIFLSSIKDPHGHDGKTSLILDENKIVGAIITVYESDKLTKSQITNIVRHELGHALGLKHCDNPDELMYEFITPDKFLTGHEGYHLVILYLTSEI